MNQSQQGGEAGYTSGTHEGKVLEFLFERAQGRIDGKELDHLEAHFEGTELAEELRIRLLALGDTDLMTPEEAAGLEEACGAAAALN
jgi:hypothetical protein